MRQRVWPTIVFALATALEVLLRSELQQRPLTAALGVAFACLLWFRRSHPLAATAAAFGLAAASTAVEIQLGLPEVGPYSGACILLLPYSLWRWGSRQQIAIGSLFIAAAFGSSMFRAELKIPADVIGGAVVLLLPCAVGIAVRYREAAQARDLQHAKLREREQLARELHDSVAHHMSAIAIQAAAARAVLASQPAAAAEAIAAIEDESRRTLVELREIVGALREEDAALTPQRGLAELAGFAREAGAAPAVIVQLDAVDDLPPAVERAVYRIAQESITNAVKHARNATRIVVRVTLNGDSVLLTTQDDGTTPNGRRNAGFGLLGMAERAALLGGTFVAGPHSNGWRVEAVLPRKGPA